MPRINYTSVLTQGWFTIVLFGLLGLILALVISFLQPLKYSSTSRVLILQPASTSADAYTVSRSEERLAENLSNVIHSTTFFAQVLESGFSIDERTFPLEDAKRRREWRKTISATVARGSGMMTLTAFHEDVRQAEQIVRAVTQVLSEHAVEYTSATNIQIRPVDDPLNSRWPVKPNILSNGLSGIVLGALAGIAFLLAQTERIRRRHQLIHEEY
jgi:capsular polysaccharide biosynthesis protein